MSVHEYLQVKILEPYMFITIAVILIILWVLGLIGHIAGALIHILIVLALISVIYHFLRGSKDTTV